jgi:putative SOS response-associated peptidase YedK
MCGRCQNLLDEPGILDLYRIQREAWGRPAKLPNANVAPRQSVPVVRLGDDGVREIVTMR